MKKCNDDKLIFDLIDSKTVLPSYNSTDPRVSIALSKDLDSYKLYLADTGLFINKILSVVVGGNPLPLGGGRSLVNS